MAFGFAASVAIHVLAVVFIPGPAAEPAPEELIEIELFPLNYGTLGYEAAAMGVSENEAKLLSQVSADALTFAEELPLGISVREPEAASAPSDLKVDADDSLQKRLPEMVEKTLDKLAKSRQEKGRPGSQQHEPWSLQPSEPKEKVRLPEAALGTASGRGDRSGVNVESIVGPVSGRSVVYWPPRDKIKISTPGSVRIKFWVQPDGTVARVTFEQKLDANLDDYAARFVRALRFEPLPEGKDYVEWGAITLTFRPE